MRSGKDDLPIFLRRNARPAMTDIPATSALHWPCLTQNDGTRTTTWSYHIIQGDSGGKVSLCKVRFGRRCCRSLRKKKVHMSMCLILNGYQKRHIWIPRPNSVRPLCGVGWRAKVTREKWIHVMFLLARIKKREDQLRRKTRDLRTQVAKALRMTVEFPNIYC